MNNKEFGSDLYYVNQETFRDVSAHAEFFSRLEYLYFSGRSALRAILEEGIIQYGWTRLYAPSYYCHEVYEFVDDLGIEILMYPYNPVSHRVLPEIDSHGGTVILVVNYFGIDRLDFSRYADVTIIEDVTLNLDALFQSSADICFGSLRKELPVPVGGFVNVNRGDLILPGLVPSREAEEIAMQKTVGMFLKSKYIRYEFNQKDIFRNLLAEAEIAFSRKETHTALPAVSREYVASLRYDKIKENKKRNSRLAKQLLRPREEFMLLTNDDDNEYACILVFDRIDHRIQLRDYLVANAIYPMVLWPDQFLEEDKKIEERILFIHIDFRHETEDVRLIVDKINQFSFLDV